MMILRSQKRSIPNNNTETDNYEPKIKKVRHSKSCKNLQKSSFDQIKDNIIQNKYAADQDFLGKFYPDRHENLKKSIRYIRTKYLSSRNAIFESLGTHDKEARFAMNSYLEIKGDQLTTYALDLNEGNHKNSRSHANYHGSGTRGETRKADECFDEILRFVGYCVQHLNSKIDIARFRAEIFNDDYQTKIALPAHVDKFMGGKLGSIHNIDRENLAEDITHLCFFVLDRTEDNDLEECKLRLYRYPYNKNECVSCGDFSSLYESDELVQIAELSDKEGAGYIIDQREFKKDGSEYEILHSRDARTRKPNILDTAKKREKFQRLSMVLRIFYPGKAGFEHQFDMLPEDERKKMQALHNNKKAVSETTI